MTSKHNSNAESSDEDLETLYQINESRPPSRESASQSIRSMASPTSVHETRSEQTMHPHENFVKTRNNRSNQERPQNDTENSGFDEIHHDYPHRENLTSADVEGDYSKYPLTPTVVIVNSKTKQTEALPTKETTVIESPGGPLTPFLQISSQKRALKKQYNNLPLELTN